MKQIDYLKLVATGRNSSYYARPSQADDDLKTIIAYGFVIAWLTTFGLAVLASYLGEGLSFTEVAKPMAIIVGPSLMMFIIGIFMGGAPRLTRIAIAAIGMTVVFILAYMALSDVLPNWYLYLPGAIFFFLVSSAAIRQLQ